MQPSKQKCRAALLAAAATVVYAAGAHAAIRTGSLADGELFLDVISSAGSATFDLGAPTVILNVPGVTVSSDPVIRDFQLGAMSDPGIKLRWDLSSTDAWASFVAATGAAGLENATFDIKALGPSDPFGASGVVYLTTSPSREALVRSQDFSQLANFDQVGDFVDMTNDEPNQNTLPNGANFADSSSDVYAQAAVGDKWKEFFIGVSTGGIGTDLAFYQLSGDYLSDWGSTADVAKYGGMWNLTKTGLLFYTTAPVPEPGTLAMLAAGVIVLGVIARRRRAIP